MAGAATQVFAREFDAVLDRLPPHIAALIRRRLPTWAAGSSPFPIIA